MNDNEINRKKAFLRRYKNNQEKIKRLEQKIEYINDRLTNVRGIRISDEPRGHSNVTKAELITNKSEYEERIENLKVESRRLKKEITKVIDTLEDTRHIDVLEAFFIDGLTFEQIAEKMNYQLRWTIFLYSQALRLIKIEDVHNSNTF